MCVPVATIMHTHKTIANIIEQRRKVEDTMDGERGRGEGRMSYTNTISPKNISVLYYGNRTEPLESIPYCVRARVCVGPRVNVWHSI